ncbi:MAG TPA: hypothetical protein VF212_09725 [Longimicrobiales bacterium]
MDGFRRPVITRQMPVKLRRIYLDTSVIGGCFDPEFAPWSKGSMRDFREGNFIPGVSELVATEVASASPLTRCTSHWRRLNTPTFS